RSPAVTASRRGACGLLSLAGGVAAGDRVVRVAGAVAVGDEAIDHLRRRQDTRQPGARVGAGADEVQALDLFRSVVEAEISRLAQHGLNGKCGPALRIQLPGERFWRDVPRRHQVGAQPRDAVPLEVLVDALAIGLARALPVGARA